MFLSARDSLSVSELAQTLAMALPSIMKYRDVLSNAGLISLERAARFAACRLSGKPMREALCRLNRYLRFWSENLDHLAGGRTMVATPEAIGAGGDNAVAHRAQALPQSGPAYAPRNEPLRRGTKNDG